MQERHTNRNRYFNEQGLTTEKYVIPCIQSVGSVDTTSTVLEIGCGEGGNLIPFVKMGCQRIVGIDLSSTKIENGKNYYKEIENGDRIEFITNDIYNMTPETLGQFDVIFMRDVLEHIHNQERFMEFVKQFLKPTGKFFLGFPPWQNPFGGHQQMCYSKFLSKLPYFHNLPRSWYKGIMKLFKEPDARIEDLLEIYDTRISIERFERILKKEKYTTDSRTFYFINPNYEIKFGLKPRKVWGFIGAIPYLRNFFITTNYYVISYKN